MGMIESLQEKRANIWEQGKVILDRAEAENRTLDAEETENYRKLNADLDSIGDQVALITEARKSNADMQAAFAAIDGQTAERPAAPEGRDYAEAFRKMASGESRGFNMSPAELRDLTKGTATSGGATVQNAFYNKLWGHLIDAANIINYATIITTAEGNPITFPTTTAHSTAALIAENSTITESDPAFVGRTLSSFKYAVAFQAPNELLQDTGVDLEGYLAMQAGRACGNALGVDLATGTGTTKPWGVMARASAGVTGGAGVVGAFTADNLIDLFYSVISPYRNSPQCAWLMKDATVATARKIKDTTGQYLWAPGLAGAGDTILGKPIITDPGIAAVALSAKSVAFGDMSQYYVRVAGGMRFERSSEFAFGTDQTTFRAIIRADGDLIDQTGAVKVFTGNAA